MASAVAKKLHDDEARYSLLHHRKRAAELSARDSLDHFEKGLLRDSLSIIAGSDAYCLRHIDLNDAAYLAELDAFAEGLAA